MFHRLSKHLEFHQKYSTTRRISGGSCVFSALFSVVGYPDEALSLVFAISHQRHSLTKQSTSDRKHRPRVINSAIRGKNGQEMKKKTEVNKYSKAIAPNSWRYHEHTPINEHLHAICDSRIWRLRYIKFDMLCVGLVCCWFTPGSEDSSPWVSVFLPSKKKNISGYSSTRLEDPHKEQLGWRLPL